MKYWYISYTYIDGFGNRQYNNAVIRWESPIWWLKTNSPKGSVILFYSQITEEEYNGYNKI